jgi:hypothetical protein
MSAGPLAVPGMISLLEAYMRLLRILVATSFAALLAQPSAAQEGRQFKDAWFWGAKTGSIVYSSASTASSVAPLFGGEWLITRTRGGLYISFDQAYLTTRGAFMGRDASGASAMQYVDVGNLRRFTAAAMVFPLQQSHIYPYAGAGFTFYQLGHTNLATGTATAATRDSILSKKTAVSPVFMVGTQVRLMRASAFVQGFASPTQKAFFLAAPVDPRTLMFGLEAGIRYNVGSRIDGGR